LYKIEIKAASGASPLYTPTSPSYSATSPSYADHVEQVEKRITDVFGSRIAHHPKLIACCMRHHLASDSSDYARRWAYNHHLQFKTRGDELYTLEDWQMAGLPDLVADKVGARVEVESYQSDMPVHDRQDLELTTMADIMEEIAKQCCADGVAALDIKKGNIFQTGRGARRKAIVKWFMSYPPICTCASDALEVAIFGASPSS
jgi:hypothetical protein